MTNFAAARVAANERRRFGARQSCSSVVRRGARLDLHHAFEGMGREPVLTVKGLRVSRDKQHPGPQHGWMPEDRAHQPAAEATRAVLGIDHHVAEVTGRAVVRQHAGQTNLSAAVKDAEAERMSHAERDLLARAVGRPIGVTQELTDAIEIETRRIVAQLVFFEARSQCLGRELSELAKDLFVAGKRDARAVRAISAGRRVSHDPLLVDDEEPHVIVVQNAAHLI